MLKPETSFAINLNIILKVNNLHDQVMDACVWGDDLDLLFFDQMVSSVYADHQIKS